jgi:YesN/AraC family two-component response regulator
MINAMIVDDEAIFRRALRSCIDWKRCGFELIGEARDGKEAMELIKIRPPDVVFTDIKMPRMDGLKLTACLQEQYPGIIVIILSAYNEFEYAQKALHFGAKDYLLKLSMSPESLEAVLENIKMQLSKSTKEEGFRKFLETSLDKNYGKIRSQVQTIIDYLITHPEENLSLNDAAGMINMNANYFGNLFKKETGWKYRSFCNLIKIQQAKEMLLHPEIKVYETADLLGFENESYFNKLFKKITGLTPNQFRRQNM